jgi:acetyl-CoA carboxylase biotin carboxyl carrier protein
MTDQAAVRSSQEEPAEEGKPAERGNRERGKRHNRPGHGGGAAGRGTAGPLDLEELRKLVELIDSHGFTDFEIEREGVHIRLRRELTPQIIQAAPAPSPLAAKPVETVLPAAPAVVPAAEPKTPAAPPAEALHIITSPIVGTFYRSPSPETGPFVNIGSRVTPDTTVCIIEAMKLMNEIQAETSGEIVEILVENGQPVEYGQPLFGVRA